MQLILDILCLVERMYNIHRIRKLRPTLFAQPVRRTLALYFFFQKLQVWTYSSGWESFTHDIYKKYRFLLQMIEVVSGNTYGESGQFLVHFKERRNSIVYKQTVTFMRYKWA